MTSLTTTQAGARLGVTVRRVQAIIASGRLRAQRIGRDWLISEADLRGYKPLAEGWRKGRKRQVS